tara:strand:+ start:390 stop:728 length:339 start_codon:yes stop_codon:yes gene_type:complete
MNHSNILMLIMLVIVEAAAMSTIEYGANNGSNVYIIGILLYILVGYILYKLLLTNQLATTNAKWNILSIIIVSSIGILYFKEKLTIYEKYGLGFAILSIILMEYDKIKIYFK